MALGEETWRRESSWSNTFTELKTIHDRAYRKIEEALVFDEEGENTKALNCYEEGLALIDKALSVNIECPRNPDFTWEKACSMVEKLRKTRKETLARIADTQVQRPTDLPIAALVPQDPMLEPPPSYDEAIATSPMSLPTTPQIHPSPLCPPQTYSELGEALQNLKIETKMQSAQIIFKVENVQIYFITPDGRVSAPSQPNLLRVLELEDGQDVELPKYFLQVGDWFYPLVRDVSPCFRPQYGAFILPDVNSDVEGAAVGLILPAGADTSLHSLLEDILQTVVAEPPPAVPLKRAIRDTISSTVSKGIVSGAQYLSSGLMKGAERASQYMNSTTPKIISQLQPEEVPRPVPGPVVTGTKVARSVTHTAANVTGYVGSEDKYTKYSHHHLKKLSSNLRKKVAVSRELTGHTGKRSHRHKASRSRTRRGEELLSNDEALEEPGEDHNPTPSDLLLTSKHHRSHAADSEVCESAESLEEPIEGSSEKYTHRHSKTRHHRRNRAGTGASASSEALKEPVEDISVVSTHRHSRSRRHRRHRGGAELSVSTEDLEDPDPENSSWHSLKHQKTKHKHNRGTATFATKKPGKVGSATMALGRYLAPHVKRGGTALLTKAGVRDQTATDSMSGVLTVAAGAVEGFGTIYTGLEQSAAILGTNLTNNTVQIVQHKYGEPMATVTGNTMYTVGNVINTTNNIQNLTPKGLAKKAAKDTGRALVEPHLAQPSSSNNGPYTPNTGGPYTSISAPYTSNGGPYMSNSGPCTSNGGPYAFSSGTPDTSNSVPHASNSGSYSSTFSFSTNPNEKK